MPVKARYTHIFSLTEADETDFQTCQAKFTQAEIVRLGIREALKHCPKPSKELLKKVEAKI